MRVKILLLVPVAMVVALLLAFRFNEKSDVNATASKKRMIQSGIVSCSPDWNKLRDWIEEVNIPPMPGSGELKWKIETNDDSAQFYFNQGINTYYGFHIIESMASFKKAASFDSTSAMIWWAQALAYGPNINDVGYVAVPDALMAVEKALRYADKATEREKILIQAQQVRYSADSTISQEILNQAYTDKMKEAYEKFPGDDEVAALYVDAMMLQHPWDLWFPNGTPKPWTPRIREVLEKLLSRNPNHLGGIHYYIHVMEPSPYASRAAAGADKLGQLAPGLAHLVHMPSHIYLRTGEYRKGAQANENAVNSYRKYSGLYEPVTGNPFLYIIHNLHMQANHAIMEGDSAYSIKSALETQKSVPNDYLSFTGGLGNTIQYIYMTPVLVNVRFGNWNELLAMAAPDKVQIYSNLLYHFGRGMAYAHRANLAQANQELTLLQQLMKDSTLAMPMSPFSPAIEGATVAENILSGTISMAEKRYIDAVNAFTRAVSTEEGMVYNEPRDWLLNPKHYLGNAYLEAKKYASARDVFLNDLRINNENGWALYGLYKALEGEKKKAEAQKALARYEKAFAKADIKLMAPVHH